MSYYVDVASSTSGLLYNLTLSNDEGRWDTFVENGLNRNGGYAIGKADNPDNPKRLAMTTPFTDSRQPVFANRAPIFTTHETSVDMQLTLDRPGMIYYAIAEADITGQELPNEAEWVPAITTKITVGDSTDMIDIQPHYIPDGGESAATMDKVTVKQPDKGDIYDPTYWAGAIDCIVGSVEYRGVGTQPETVDNLKPNRTYYALFVITGSAREPSEIHIYKFKTSPVVKPKITINSTTNGVSLMTDINSNLEYLVYSTADAEKISLLQEKLNKPQYLAKVDTLPTAYENYTVRQALQEYYVYQTAKRDNTNTGAYFPIDGTGSYVYFNNYSVFDIYASEDLKAKIGNWIRSGGLPEGSSGVDYTEKSDTVIQLPAGRPLSQALQKVRPGGVYVIFAVSQNQSAEVDADPAAIDTFKAFSPVQITDPEAPELIALTNLGLVRDKDGKISGSIQLSFDKLLYRGTTTQVALIKQDTISDIIAGNGYNKDSGVTVRNEETGTAGSFEITFDGSSTVPSFVIQQGTLRNAGGTPADKLLTVRFETETLRGDAMTTTRYWVMVDWGDERPKYRVQYDEKMDLNVTNPPGGGGANP